MRRARVAALLLGLSAVLLAVYPLSGAPDKSAELLRACGVRAGLAVHLGSSDGRLEAGLTDGGRVVVHGLALDDKSVNAARLTLLAKGLYGVASVERWTAAPALPYADNLVNLLVADLDALGGKAPRREEILRVVCPGGVAYLRAGGKWAKTVKPRPKELDDWTHLDHGPEANGVSHDNLVRQPNFVQWVCGVQPIRLGGNPAAFVNLTGVRVAGGRAFFDYLEEPGKGYRRSMMAFGQVESSWPVYGAALHGGLVWASAGLHPELGGGVTVCGLDPKTGVARARRVLHKSPARVETRDGRSQVTVVPQSFLNDVPKSDGDRLTIGGFAFDPKESDEELRKRLDTPPPKKK